MPRHAFPAIRQVTDGFGRLNRTPRDLEAPTIDQMRQALNADTPENNRRNAACDDALIQIERAFGPQRS